MPNPPDGIPPIGAFVGSAAGPGASPGVVIFTVRGKLSYINGEALDILRAIAGSLPVDAPGLTEKTVLAICAEAGFGEEGAAQGGPTAGCFACNGQRYAMRSVKLFKSGQHKKASHTMLIIEKSLPPSKFSFDDEKVREAYGLTVRELDIVREIIKGSTNQEIAAALCISEYTVKDYVKKILSKMNVGNRASIFGKIFS